jgi:probable H4MPT-linked C1 transfer pathway protein
MASSQGSAILGWDIGGVNTKAVRLEDGERDLSRVRALSAAYELQRNPAELVPTLRRLAGALGHREGASHAVTMTAELSQAFRTKRQGVAFVLSAVRTAFPEDEILVYTVSGRFLSPEQACDCPLDVGASNWAATARLAGRLAGDCMLIDTGSTTTDVIPVLAGEPAVEGATDPARLLSGELVYTGALRTPAEAVTSELPLWDGRAAVAAEGFALIGDAHLWLGSLRSEDYTVPTPDGRPATREYAGERIARSVCGDREMLDASAIDRIAAALAAGARPPSLDHQSRGHRTGRLHRRCSR